MSQSTVICTLKARLVVPMWIERAGAGEGSWGLGVVGLGQVLQPGDMFDLHKITGST